jgi:hypothetical protein
MDLRTISLVFVFDCEGRGCAPVEDVEWVETLTIYHQLPSMNPKRLSFSLHFAHYNLTLEIFATWQPEEDMKLAMKITLLYHQVDTFYKLSVF